MANKISVILDIATDKAVGGLKGFKASVQDADGAVGKMKAGASSAFGAIQQHAAGMALAAGGALVAFGAKGVAAFTGLAIEAGKFRDVSGATLDEASRWIAVGDDIGVSGDAISGAWNKMNIAIGSGKPLLKEYGIELKKTADGQDDANATFLNAIDTINGIKDPTKKAELAAATFGKGWTSMSELIEQGSGTITAAMAEVSDAQIIDESEIAKAKKFRESVDKLTDSISDLAMEFGEELTPVVSAAAETLSAVAPVAGAMAKAVGSSFERMIDGAYDLGKAYADLVDGLPFIDLPGPIAETAYELHKLEQGTADLVAEFSGGAPTMEVFASRLDAAGITGTKLGLAIIEYRKQLEGANTVTGEAADATDELTESTEGSTLAHWDATAAAEALEKADKAAAEEQERAKDAADDYNRVLQEQRDATDDLVASKTALVGGDIAVREAQRQAAEAVGALNVLTKEGKADTEEFAVAQDAAATAMLGAAQAAADAAVDQATANGAVVSAKDANQIYKEKLMELASTLAPGSPLLLQIQGYIDALNRIPTEVDTRIRATGGGTIGLLPQIGVPHASGGPVAAGVAYPVGEQGPELFMPSTSGTIIPNGALGGGMGGVVVNVAVQTLDGTISPAALSKLVEAINGGIRTGSLKIA